MKKEAYAAREAEKNAEARVLQMNAAAGEIFAARAAAKRKASAMAALATGAKVAGFGVAVGLASSAPVTSAALPFARDAVALLPAGAQGLVARVPAAAWPVVAVSTVATVLARALAKAEAPPPVAYSSDAVRRMNEDTARIFERLRLARIKPLSPMAKVVRVFAFGCAVGLAVDPGLRAASVAIAKDAAAKLVAAIGVVAVTAAAGATKAGVLTASALKAVPFGEPVVAFAGKAGGGAAAAAAAAAGAAKAGVVAAACAAKTGVVAAGGAAKTGVAAVAKAPVAVATVACVAAAAFASA